MGTSKSEVSDPTESSMDVPSQIKAQVELPQVKASFLGFYKYATKLDILLVLTGIFFSIVEGVALPMFTLVAGSLTNNFNTALVDGGSTSEFKHNVNHNSLYFVYIGIGIFGAGWISAALLANRGEVLASRFRKIYLQKTLGQNIAYFDKLGSGEVTTRITNSTTAIQEAISEKTGTICSAIACFITALVIAFVTQWKLSCILLSGVFFIIFDMIVGSGFMIKYVKLSDSAYSQGSSVVEESISAIRTGVAFGIQSQLAAKFDVYLKKSVGFSYKKNYILAAMLGTLWGAIFWIYALSFWEGSRILVDGDTKIGDIFVVISCMIIGAFQFGNIGPESQFIVKGLAGLADVNETILRTPAIDSNAPGLEPDSVHGHIQFENVHFRYPSRPDVVVLPNFSLEIRPGQTVALVGSSGCGKSTCIGILERFYQILGGRVLLDGQNIEDLQVKWLRQQLGLVSQEPTLFAVSIYENIAFGLVGTPFESADEEKKREMVVEACKQANAYDFIQTLTDGLDTNVGDRGFLLSGGQKQRIAIARAIVSDPKILLLDEATSALDTKSEGIVQEALDRAAKSRTTIVIAHRLSTIRNADKIVVMAHGEIIEQGTHHELLANKRNYYDLVMAQNLSQDSGDSDGDNAEQPQQLVQEDDPVLLRRGTSMSAKSQSSYHHATDMRKPSLFAVLRMLWRLNQEEHKWIIGGAVFTILLGYGYPAMAILVGKTISSMIIDPSEYHHMRNQVNLYSGMLFMVGVEQLISAALMTLCFTIASEGLVRKVRLNMFKQFMRMDMSYFDDAAHTPGSLTSMIAKEGKSIEGLGGSTLGQILQSVVIVIGGVAQSIAFNWRIGLVATACVPIMLGAGFGRVYILNRLNERTSRTYEGSGSLASSYASAVRTVQALALEDRLCSVYNAKIDNQVRDSLVPHISSGMAFGFSQALTPWVIALIFWYGSNQLMAGHVTVSAFFVVFIGSIMGSQAAGSVFSYAPNMGKAKEASQNVYSVIYATPRIDYTSENGIKLSQDEVVGNVEFKDVNFHYPTRPQVPVLRGLNLSVKKGDFIALVGPSGCGKSTCIQLIEHFYDVQKGAVLIDGHDIADVNVSNLRSHISLVQQEPLLFSGTVRENILHGWSSDDTSEVSDEYLYSICKKANIHDFVMGLPDGYDTDIGAHGALLSGGQKQRIAIARALLRNPKILLLDEATSALDSQSEKIVQAALDEAAKGRTTIAVAHRLSTIQHADRIFVFERGRILEAGTHEELLKLKGSYAELVRLQDLED